MHIRFLKQKFYLFVTLERAMGIRRNLWMTATALALLPGLGFGANINEVSERVETLEGSVELLEEANAELRKDLDDRLRVSGYVDVEYIIQKDKDNTFRMHHMSLFFQKKISDKWKFFSEIEYEDTPKFSASGAKDADGNYVLDSGGEGKIFVEAVNLDYNFLPQAIFRFGRFFTPAGIWSVDHYPPFVSTQERPGHIRNIFPQLVDGAMVYGTLNLGGHYLNYDFYYVNGEGNTGKKDKNADKAMGLKASAILNVPMFSHLEVGGTGYFDPEDSKNGDQEKTALGVHAKLKYTDFILQTEAAFAQFSGDTSDKATRSGYYAQFIWEPAMWSLGVRHDNYYDRSNSDAKVTNSVFANYRFNTNLVVKVEHHIIDNAGTDDNKTVFSVVSYLE